MSMASAGSESRGVTTSRLRSCRVCNGPVDFALTAQEMMIGTGDCFDYFECRDCGCLQISPIPSDLDRYYARSYYTNNQRVRAEKASGELGFRRRWTRDRLRQSRFARVISGRRYGRVDLFRRTRTRNHDEILDVGCGSGRLLFRLYAEGFERLTGIDVRLGDVSKTGRGPDFERVSPEDHRGLYHLVMSHHSFEHMEDPVCGFAAFARLVEPGGYLLLRLPLADSWVRRHHAANWVQLDAPRHLHLHTRRSIAILAERSGFRVTHVADDSGPFQIWGSELYRRGVPLAQAGRGGRNELSLLERLRARLRARRLSRQGLGDQACFYLQRLGDAQDADNVIGSGARGQWTYGTAASAGE
jgi:SAM-dependent methyltransferase